MVFARMCITGDHIRWNVRVRKSNTLCSHPCLLVLCVNRCVEHRCLQANIKLDVQLSREWLAKGEGERDNGGEYGHKIQINISLWNLQLYTLTTTTSLQLMINHTAQGMPHSGPVNISSEMEEVLKSAYLTLRDYWQLIFSEQGGNTVTEK